MKKEKNIVNNEYTFLELPIEKYDFYDDPEVIKYIDSLPDYKRPSKSELEEMLSRKSDKDVMDKLIKIYMFLPVKYASEMSSKTNLSNMDLISEGNLGLINAINEYSVSNGNFYRYLTRYIRKSIIKACLVGAKASNMSQNTYETIVELKQIDEQLQKEYSREKILEEELLIEWLDKQQIHTDGSNYKISPKERREKNVKKAYFDECRDLDCEIVNLDLLDLEQTLGEDYDANIDKIVELDAIKNIFIKAFNDDIFTKEEKYILMSLYGFSKSKTTRELSEELNISMSQVYLIYKRALLKMKKITFYKLYKFRDDNCISKENRK